MRKQTCLDKYGVDVASKSPEVRQKLRESSNTIVDPFAGWGARSDAAKKLGKTYIGCDLNLELVKWHIDCGRTNISLGNAVDFKFSDTCSVFICPPYSDPSTGRCFEDYNFEGFDESAKSMSQCD